jgi:hypothetical protein
MNYTLQINRFESNNRLINYVFNLPEVEINAKIEEYKTPGFVKLLMRVLDNNSRVVKSIELKETPVSTSVDKMATKK